MLGLGNNRSKQIMSTTLENDDWMILTWKLFKPGLYVR